MSATRALEARTRARGGVLVLIGADGAGKSTQAKQLRARAGVPTRYIYMGSNPSAITHALPTTRAWTWLKGAVGREVHHSGPPTPGARPRPSSALARGRAHLKSLAALGLRASEDLYRLLLAEVYARRGHLVIMDRHPYPDYYMRRVKETGVWQRVGDRLHGLLLEHVYPRPDRVVLLDAPAEVLHARKPEGTLEALRARRAEYVELCGALQDVEVTVVDVARPQEEVLTDLLRIAGEPGGDAWAGRARLRTRVAAQDPERGPDHAG
jgi:thymidylate kinase